MLEIYDDPLDEEPDTVLYVDGLEYHAEIDKLVNERHLLIGPGPEDAPNILDLVAGSHLGGIKYCALMDRNIVSYLIQVATQKHTNARIYRIAIALLAKLQLANIQSEPAMSYYEYNESHDTNVLEELQLFRQMDSSPIRSVIAFALGQASLINVPEIQIDPTPLEKAIRTKAFPTPLKAFDYNFTTMKKAYSLALLNFTPEEIIQNLLLWMKDTYLFSANAYFATLIYFSPNRIRKTMKNASIHQVRNQTWDLALAQYCKEENSKPDKTQIWFLSSNDSVVQTVYRLSTHTSQSDEDAYDLLNYYCRKYWTDNIKSFTRILGKTMEIQTQIRTDSMRPKRTLTDNYIHKLNKSLDKQLKQNLLQNEKISHE